mgnify:CR=1 FL=1
MKTEIIAEEGRQDLHIIREFDLPTELLYTAFIEPEIVEQWMGTKVIKLDPARHGSYQFETTDPRGSVHRFSGTIHEVESNKKITRTFEMENTPFPVQLEFLSFDPLPDHKSRLTMHVIYKSVTDRDNMLRLPFEQGINMAHNRLQEIFNNKKN